MASVALVHPPAGPVLLGAVALELVVVVVPGAELHAVVGREELIAGVITEIVAVKGVSGVSTDEVGVGQAVFVSFRTHPEHGVVCSAVRMEWRMAYLQSQGQSRQSEGFCKSRQCRGAQSRAHPMTQDGSKSLQGIPEKLKSHTLDF